MITERFQGEDGMPALMAAVRRALASAYESARELPQAILGQPITSITRNDSSMAAARCAIPIDYLEDLS